MSKHTKTGMRGFTIEDEVFDENDYTEQDKRDAEKARKENASKKDKISWSTRFPRLSRFFETCLSIFLFLIFVSFGVLCIAAAATILVEGTKALLKIIGGLF